MLATIRSQPLPSKRGGTFRRVALLVAGCLVALALFTSDALAGQLPVPLGAASSYAALAGSTVTSTGPTTLNGDLGVWPGTSLTGFPPGMVSGAVHAGDPFAMAAQGDLTAAYNDAASRQPPQALPADVGGRTLAPGVYKTGATPALGVTGTLTLDGQGDPNAVFVFQVGSALTTAVSSRVNLIGGAQAGNVFWQIGSSATLGTSSTFAGSILALTSISVNSGVTLNGRALARNGAVTLIGDTINAPAGSPPPPPPPPPPAGVVRAMNWTGNPSAGGQLIATEWLRLGLKPGAESVRRETSDGILATRTDVRCVSGALTSGLCPTVREMALPSRDKSIRATYSQTRGGYLGDPNVQQPSDLKDATLLAAKGATPAARGPLGSVLLSWQTPPPGHGSTYERYDISVGGSSDSVWVDMATQLPLRITVGTGRDQQTTYWTYDPKAIDPATLPGDFFALPVAADPAQNQQVDYYGTGRLPGSVTDPDTHARFTPLSLGPAATVEGRALCLASANLFRDFESGRGFADRQDSRITRVDSDYVLNSNGTSCNPGLGDASQADLQISTFARRSAIAAANRRAFAGARTVRTRIMGLRARVYLMRGGDQDTLALVDVGNRTVLIRSSLPTASGSQAITTQILSILSGLHGSALNATADSRVALRAAAAPTARAAAVEDITHANWLFTGSTYGQSSGTPNRKKREDPVSVIWKGGGQASINNVRNYTQTYWQESAIPKGYPGGKEMKVRDSSLPPSGFCRNSSHVWFRRTGTAPNKGKFEESDPHGYMSTNGLCASQYHIRMWSSTALHDLTGQHLLEFVLAPIHHDHVEARCAGKIVFGVCIGIRYPKHGSPDLSFDKARYAYARVMSFKVCTFIHWKVNPESEGFDYQKLGKYSGFVSRITFWLTARHRTCKGV